MSEIRYGKSTLPECCKHLAGRMGEPYKSCLHLTWQQMRQSREAPFQEVFGQNMRAGLRELPLQKEDLDLFLQPFSESGFQDGNMQLRSIEQCLEQIRLKIRESEKEQKEKCRMAVGLGAMSGLLLLIILL